MNVEKSEKNKIDIKLKTKNEDYDITYTNKGKLGISNKKAKSIYLDDTFSDDNETCIKNIRRNRNNPKLSDTKINIKSNSNKRCGRKNYKDRARDEDINNVLANGLDLINQMIKTSNNTKNKKNKKDTSFNSVRVLMSNIINHDDPEKMINLDNIPTDDNIVIDKTNNIKYEEGCITGSYYNDLNILTIHQIIINKLNKEKYKIKELEKELNTLLINFIENPSAENINKRILDLKKTIEDINNETKLKTYTKLSKNYIDTYKKYPKINDSFGYISEDDISDEKLKLILNYLDICEKYIKIDIIRKFVKKNNCTTCGNIINEYVPDINGYILCNNCGTCTIPLSLEDYIFDKPKEKKKLSDVETYKKSLNRYVNGKVDFNQTLIDDLDRYFEINNQPTSQTIGDYELRGNIVGRRIRGPTSIRMMKNALIKTNNGENISDVY
jgi:hypothetical protein